MVNETTRDGPCRPSQASVTGSSSSLRACAGREAACSSGSLGTTAAALQGYVHRERGGLPGSTRRPARPVSSSHMAQAATAATASTARSTPSIWRRCGVVTPRSLARRRCGHGGSRNVAFEKGSGKPTRRDPGQPIPVTSEVEGEPRDAAAGGQQWTYCLPHRNPAGARSPTDARTVASHAPRAAYATRTA